MTVCDHMLCSKNMCVAKCEAPIMFCNSPHDGYWVNLNPRFGCKPKTPQCVGIYIVLLVEPRLWVHLKPLVVRKPKTHVCHESDSILFNKQPNKIKAISATAAVTNHSKRSKEHGQAVDSSTIATYCDDIVEHSHFVFLTLIVCREGFVCPTL